MDEAAETLLFSLMLSATKASGITHTEWKPVSFIFKFRTGESLEALQIRSTPLCVSGEIYNKLNLNDDG